MANDGTINCIYTYIYIYILLYIHFCSAALPCAVCTALPNCPRYYIYIYTSLHVFAVCMFIFFPKLTHIHSTHIILYTKMCLETWGSLLNNYTKNRLWKAFLPPPLAVGASNRTDKSLSRLSLPSSSLPNGI